MNWGRAVHKIPRSVIVSFPLGVLHGFTQHSVITALKPQAERAITAHPTWKVLQSVRNGSHSNNINFYKVRTCN